MSWLELEDKVVVVTGAASGIGKHIVSTLNHAGAKTVIVDLGVETGETDDGAFAVKCDVTSAEDVQKMMDEVSYSRDGETNVLRLRIAQKSSPVL